jgi:hypothetical protein
MYLAFMGCRVGTAFQHEDGTDGAAHQADPIENKWKKFAAFFFCQFDE